MFAGEIDEVMRGFCELLGGRKLMKVTCAKENIFKDVLINFKFYHSDFQNFFLLFQTFFFFIIKPDIRVYCMQ